MNLKEMLKAKQAELVELKAKIAEGDEEAIVKGGEITDEIEALEAKIKAADKANAMLKSIGSKEEKEDEPEVKTGMKSLIAQAKSVDKTRKDWSISAEFKANTDVVTSVRIADVDRSVEPSETRAPRIADLFPQARISGNAVTVFTEGEVEGDVGTVQEGAKKPQLSTSFSPTTYALAKIAGFIKETDEILDDNDFLASAVEEVLLRKLVKKENNYVISSVKALTTATPVEYTLDASDANATTQAMMEAILEAKAQIEDGTDYVADIVIMNPADYVAMQLAKDSNGQYFGGGWASGAYGNGSYNASVTPWGMRIFVSNDATSHLPLVLASEAVKIYRKNDASVKVYEQNEDDALYNRVTVLAEERLLAILKNGKALVKIQPAA